MQTWNIHICPIFALRNQNAIFLDLIGSNIHKSYCSANGSNVPQMKSPFIRFTRNIQTYKQYKNIQTTFSLFPAPGWLWQVLNWYWAKTLRWSAPAEYLQLWRGIFNGINATADREACRAGRWNCSNTRASNEAIAQKRLL